MSKKERYKLTLEWDEEEQVFTLPIQSEVEAIATKVLDTNEQIYFKRTPLTNTVSICWNRLIQKFMFTRNND